MANIEKLQKESASLVKKIEALEQGIASLKAVDFAKEARSLRKKKSDEIDDFLLKIDPILQKVLLLSDGELISKSGEIHLSKTITVSLPSFGELDRISKEDQGDVILALKSMAANGVDKVSLRKMATHLERLYALSKHMNQYDVDFEKNIKKENAAKWNLLVAEKKELIEQKKKTDEALKVALVSYEEIKESCGWKKENEKTYKTSLSLSLGYNEKNGLGWDFPSQGVFSVHTKGGVSIPNCAYDFYQALFLKFLYSYPYPDRKILYLSKKTNDAMNNFLSHLYDSFGKDVFFDGVQKIDSSDFDDKMPEIFASLRKTIEERSALLSRENLRDILSHNLKNPENRKPLVLVVLNCYPDGFERLYDMEYVFSNAAKTGVYFFAMEEKRDLRKNSYSDELITDPSSYSPETKDLDFSSNGFVHKNDIYHTISLDQEDLASLLKPLLVVKKAEKSVLSYDDVGFGKEKIKPSDVQESISIPVGRMDDKIYNIEFAVSGSDDSKPIAYLLIGSPKMGKSSLIDSMIYNGSMKYSPDDLNFYLIDFKDGVSSAQYATDCKMPHIKVLAESSKQEEAEIILRTLLNEQSRRNALFKKEKGCKNLVDYNRLHEKHLPRIVVVIDEVQKLFKEDSSDYGRSDRLSGYLEQIVREGRSAGLHVVLASQDASRKMMTCVGKFVPGRFCFGAAYEDAENILSRENAKRVMAECTKPGIALVSHDSGVSAKKVKIAYHNGHEISYAEAVRKKWKNYPVDVAIVGEDGPLMIEDVVKTKTLFEEDRPSFPLGESFFDHSVFNLSFDNYHHSCFILGENEKIQANLLRNIILGAYRENGDVALIDESRDLGISDTFLNREEVKILTADDYLDELGRAYFEFKKRSHNRRERYRPYFLVIAGLSMIDDFVDNNRKTVSNAVNAPKASSQAKDLDGWDDLPEGFDMGLQSMFQNDLASSSSPMVTSNEEETIYGRDTLFKMLSSMNKANDFYIVMTADKVSSLRSGVSSLSECDYRIIHSPFVDSMGTLLGNLYKKSLADSCNANIILVSEKGQSLMKVRYYQYDEDKETADEFIEKRWERI